MMSPVSDSPQRPHINQSHNRSPSFFSSFRKELPQRSNSMLSKSNGNSQLTRAASPSQQLALHPEIKSAVALTIAHAHKVYFSGPLLRKIERQPDGQRPAKDDGWVEVWAQLGGTTLSVWGMKQVQEASQQGKEVPPTYVNTTDAFIQVLGSVTMPAAADVPEQRYNNIIALNTAGSNLLLFSCPSTAALISWAAALRLSAWEKSRLEEIYTAHLLRINMSGRDTPSSLTHGRLEGWVRIRVAGQTDWKKVWLVVTSASTEVEPQTQGGVPTAAGRKKRMSNFFNRDASPSRSGPSENMISLYNSPKPRDRRRALLTMTQVSQAFAVYPERPELISKSTLLKIEGLMGDEDGAGAMKSREGWLLVLPELEANMNPSAEMLKWISALHDSFGLYGRPTAWTWDPRDPISLMFAYPVGPQKDLLFLDREAAENLDPRDDRTSVIRSQLLEILVQRMRQMDIPGPPQQQRPSLEAQHLDVQSGQAPSLGTGSLLPPLNFDGIGSQKQVPDKALLTPITEKSSIMTHVQTLSVDGQSILGGQGSGPRPLLNAPSPVSEEKPESRDNSFLGGNVTQSPVREEQELPPIPQDEITPTSPSPNLRRPSLDSNKPGRSSVESGSVSPANIRLPPSAHVSPFERSPPLRTLSATSSTMSSQTSTSSRSHLTETSPPVSQSPTSVLTSPYSVNEVGPHGISGLLKNPYSPPRPKKLSIDSDASVLTSPYSTSEASHSTFGYSQSSVPPSRPSTVPLKNADPLPSSAIDFSHEAGALYYMQLSEKEAPTPVTSPSSSNIPRVPTTIAENGDDEEDDSETEEEIQPTTPINRLRAASSASKTSETSQSPVIGSRSPPLRPMAFDRSVPEDQNRPNSRLGLGRKPSGARAQATSRLNTSRLPSHTQQQQQKPVLQAEMERDEEDEASDLRNRMESSPASGSEDPNLDALAALSYLDVNDDKLAPSIKPIESLHSRHADQQPTVTVTPLPPASAESTKQFKSSFAPSKHAAERKAKVQAQHAAQQAAAHRPGRGTNGKRKMRAIADKGAWNESSDEEEEEEEEEEEDVDSDAEPPVPKPARPPLSQGLSDNHAPDSQPHQPQATYSHLRGPRTLPQVPGARLQENEDYQGMSRRQPSDQHSDVGRRTYLEGDHQSRPQSEFPQPGPPRHTMWSQVLEPGHSHTTAPEPVRDTFVQLEPPSQTMTKAFTPQGLLSAGLQDKQDRSAKRQEELARESGASLINVPNKPPPPQTGLLGAITAHERERKREGGVGAALTEREREKRLAEERQRRFDDHQRQQLDQMQQGGSMYGYNPLMNPMMMGMNPMVGMNPMMTGGMPPMMTGGGMNPMMTGGGMGMNPMMTGFPGMMPSYNPQHLFAAQQAAQAYQQAMMAFSVAGSQAGGDGGAAAPPLNPMMSGNIGSMNFDPRMSMMGMPMMGSMPMQMTGMSTFDPRFPPSNNLTPGNESGPTLGQYHSNNSSPAGRGSPLARPIEQSDVPRHPSRPTSPKP